VGVGSVHLKQPVPQHHTDPSRGRWSCILAPLVDSFSKTGNTGSFPFTGLGKFSGSGGVTDGSARSFPMSCGNSGGSGEKGLGLEKAGLGGHHRGIPKRPLQNRNPKGLASGRKNSKTLSGQLVNEGFSQSERDIVFCRKNLGL
jgi:hypothetical protein